MRILLFLALMAVFAIANSVEIPSEEQAKMLLSWQRRCESASDICWLEKQIEFRRDAGPEKGGVEVAYNRRTHTAEYVSIIVPRDATPGSEVIVWFVDSVKRNGKWAFVPAGGGLSLPISGCDANACVARVHPKIPDGPNLFNQFQRRSFLWVLFTRSEKAVRFLVPLSGLNDALQAVK